MPENPKDMKNKEISRRTFLTTVTVALGAVGAGFAAVPFIEAMSPTKDILASGRLEVDISSLKDGELKTVIWRKQPVFILRRTPQMIEAAAGVDPSALADPASPADRVFRPDLFVCIGICTHLGCIPKFIPDRVPDTDQPGFYCPCHGGKYDTLGRRLAGPPPENLHLVPYKFETENRLLIGTEKFSGYGADVRKIDNLPKV
jgi:ubiquinol-cytochrome c reductase iron-sulfur subunit